MNLSTRQAAVVSEGCCIFEIAYLTTYIYVIVNTIETICITGISKAVFR